MESLPEKNVKAFSHHPRRQSTRTDATSEAKRLGNYRKGDLAEGVFGGFLAFMTVLGLSTPFTVGLTWVTGVCAAASAVGLATIVNHLLPKQKNVKNLKQL